MYVCYVSKTFKDLVSVMEGKNPKYSPLSDLTLGSFGGGGALKIVS